MASSTGTLQCTGESRDRYRRATFAGISERDWPDALINRLRTRYEIGNGETEAIKNIKVEEIFRQAPLDIGYLLNNYGAKAAPSELVAGQEALKRLGLLDTPLE